MYTIAIHDGHTASLALLKDGEVIYAVQEERLVNEKNIGGFPCNGLNDLLLNNNISIRDVDRFALVGRSFTDKDSLVNRDAVLSKYADFFGLNTLSNLRKAKKIIRPFIPQFIIEQRKRKIFQDPPQRFVPLLNMGVSREQIFLYDHHRCHAAAAAYGWDRSDHFAVVTLDSSGDGISGTVNTFQDGSLNRIAEIKIGDSIARIYSLVTYYMGMVPMEHEYKLMGMAPYGESSHQARAIADYFHSLFELNQDGLTYKRKPGVEPVFMMGPRLLHYLPFKRFDHICAGLQLFVEEFASQWIRNILKTLNCSYLALSGGLFMNVKLNKRIMELDEVQDLFVFPSCGDESNVFGAAYLDWFEQTGDVPKPIGSYCLGGEFTKDQILNSLRNYQFINCSIDFEYLEGIEAEIAKLLSEKQVVARFNGQMEFGARALGNRSILANPSDPDAVRTINKMIKNRDFWMPFAPSMIDSQRYIYNPKKLKAPYMILSFDTQPDKVKTMSGAVQPYDGTCRPQKVFEEWSPSYFKIIKEYEKLTGESVVLNTSFNLHGYPLVYKPEDALMVFDNSGLQYLAIGDFLVTKSNNFGAVS